MEKKEPDKRRNWGCCRSPEGRSREGQRKNKIDLVKGTHLVGKEGKEGGGREERGGD